MYVPRADESMLRDAPKPIEFNPFADIAAHVAEERELIEREITELREIVGPMLSRRRQDD